MKPAPFFAAAIVLSILTPGGDVVANGGGYVTGGAESTGDIAGFEPKSAEGIRMAEEDLHIKLGPKSAKVEIRYRMENQTKRRVAVRFGFPVEESPAVHGLGIGAVLPDPSRITTHTSLLYCKNYRIFDGEKQLKPKWQAENRAATDERFTNLAGWQVSEVAFSPGEAKEWRISFESVYPRNIHGVSDDGYVSAAVFKYRLSTAACWAGTIGKGRIVLEPDGIDPEELRVIKPVNRFRKEGANWVWSFTELEPTLEDDLEIEAQPGVSTFHRGEEGRPLTYINRGDRWELGHANYGIKASTTLPPDGDLRYDPENLKEWDKAWSEGAPGPGVGEWLELTPVSAKPLAALSFTPGYSRSGAGFYKANARPKRVRIELNEEHGFSADVEDLSESVRIPITGYDKPVSKIRMTFEEVWPGERFEDLCLRTLRLHARLNSDPKIQPSR